jgi:hypothetical protein
VNSKPTIRRKQAFKALARVVLWLVFTVALVSGTIAATLGMGLVCRNAVIEAVASPTESGLLSRPNTLVFGRGASIRKVDGVASITLRTPRPPYACRNANGGLLVSRRSLKP